MISVVQPCKPWNQDLEEELPLAMAGFLPSGAGDVDHAHGPLPLLRADPVETCLPILRQYRGILVLAPHAQAVHPHGPAQAPAPDSG